MDWLWSHFSSPGWFAVIWNLLYYVLKLIAFLVTALGLHRLAVKRKMPYPWIAWIPVVRYHLLGQMIGGALKLTPRFHIPAIGYLMVFTSAFMILLSGSLPGTIAMILTVVLASFSYCGLFRQYREPHALVYGFMAGLPYLEIIGCFLIWRVSGLPLPDPHNDTTVFPENKEGS